MRFHIIFNDTALAQLVMVSLAMLAAVSSSIYSITTLAVAYLFTVAACLVTSGFPLAGIFMLLAEIHVVYIIFCLSLSWVRFDTISSSSVESSSTLYYGAISLAIAALVLLFGLSSASTSSLSVTYIVLLLASGSDYTLFIQKGLASMLPLLAFSYTHPLLYEFLTLNVLMFVASYVYYKLRESLREASVESACPESRTALEALKEASTPIRSQSQVEQLDADTAVRCFTCAEDTVEDVASRNSDSSK